MGKEIEISKKEIIVLKEKSLCLDQRINKYKDTLVKEQAKFTYNRREQDNLWTKSVEKPQEKVIFFKILFYIFQY